MEDTKCIAMLEMQAVAGQQLVVVEDLACLLEGFKVWTAMRCGMVSRKEVLREQLGSGDQRWGCRSCGHCGSEG